MELTENDLVFVTNGSCTESAALGDNDHPPQLTVESGEGSSWSLWKHLAVQNPLFGRPEKFCSDIQATKWESATVTLLDDRIAPYIQEVCQRDPYSGKVVTGGIVTVKDSAWLMSWTFNRQPHFKAQPKEQLVGWIYGLYPNEPGDYVGKPMEECTGAEICMEWLYHLGVPEVYSSVYDVRCLLNATRYLLDGRKLTEMKLPLPLKIALRAGLDKLDGTTLMELLYRYDLV